MGSRHEMPQPTGPTRDRHSLRSESRTASRSAKKAARRRSRRMLVPFLLSAVLAGMGGVVAEAAVRTGDVTAALPRLSLPQLTISPAGTPTPAPTGEPTRAGSRDAGSRDADRVPEPLPTVNLAELLSPVPDPATPPATEPAVTPTPVPPPVPTVPERGDGVISPVDVPPVSPAATGRVVTYSVEAEGGLGADLPELAAVVSTVLADTRGWQAVQGISLRPVAAAEVAAGAAVHVRVTLASPGLTDELCAPLDTQSEVSCWNGERAVLNVKRWFLGVPGYGTDLAGYRTYLVNHEVGHGLGNRHASCPAPGAPAPVMVQQTISLQGCTPWPWPTGP